MADFEGKLMMKGSEPFTFLALTSKDGVVYKLSGPAVKELSAHQNEVISIRGKVLKKRVGPGFPAVLEIEEYYLSEEQ